MGKKRFQAFSTIRYMKKKDAEIEYVASWEKTVIDCMAQIVRCCYITGLCSAQKNQKQTLTFSWYNCVIAPTLPVLTAHNRHPPSCWPPVHGFGRYLRSLRQSAAPARQEKEVRHQSAQENSEPCLQRVVRVQGESCYNVTEKGNSLLTRAQNGKQRQKEGFLWRWRANKWSPALLSASPSFCASLGATVSRQAVQDVHWSEKPRRACCSLLSCFPG